MRTYSGDSLSVAWSEEERPLAFDGSHLEKRPDLSIYLSNRTQHFPHVVEAKILDGGKTRTVAAYCDHGLLRFR